MPDFCPVSNLPAGMPEKRGELGVLICERDGTPPFAESDFIRRLMRAAPRYGLDVFAFAPWTWNADRRSVQAWRWAQAKGGWHREERAVPSLVYDRAWPGNAEQRRRFRSSLNRMLGAHAVVRLNGRLPGKAEVFRILARDPLLAPRLPPTALYKGKKALADWLDLHGGAVFLKPSNGSHGRRVAAVIRSAADEGAVTIRGRTSANAPFRLENLSVQEAIERLHRWIGGRVYIMQPLLSLSDADGNPFDLRVLAQRNGKGRWTLAGMAVRAGRTGNVTANLHGGGVPRHARTFLASRFGEKECESMLQEIRRVSAAVIKRLEEAFGRFCELGLDFGIDRSGRIWFLEANAKPGRAAMACAGAAAAQTAIERPLAYARYILLRPSGRVIHEFDLV
ncbi:MAG: hypothetical protein C6P35_03500 [Cohnella sp.]|nr:MAG: hypothetical protein C6P35_03500 [Cohnella sp.]